jgi:DNA (cytosine-5)-methyltransferase 1
MPKETKEANPIQVVDLFAGPGGLAEGFASLRVDGSRAFKVALSVEKETSAHSTLLLRSFFRQFDAPPNEYYDYVAAKCRLEEADTPEQRKKQARAVAHARSNMITKHSEEWKTAQSEARCLELGTEAASKALRPLLKAIRIESGENAVLLGGPPCQAYSLVGRARNKGVEGYDPSKDRRHFLYEEYIKILNSLCPAVFVMENVKGLLSSRVGEDAVFKRVLADLGGAGKHKGGYALFPLSKDAPAGDSRFIVRSEKHGIPQRRHRVIILGIRKDRLKKLSSAGQLNFSLPAHDPVSLEDAIFDMPPLRSGLSRGKDAPKSWKDAAIAAMRAAANACGEEHAKVRTVLVKSANALKSGDDLPRTSCKRTVPKNDLLAEWISDRPPHNLPNHASRSHMPSDLSRYAFAAAFAQEYLRTPKAEEFPTELAPHHENWSTGKFADRFRVQCKHEPSTTITSHISKDGHYYIHPDISQCRSLTVREAARLQTFPDNYLFEGNRSQQYVQVGNAVPPLLAREIAEIVHNLVRRFTESATQPRPTIPPVKLRQSERRQQSAR